MVRLLGALAALALTVCSASAQNYPARPVRVIVPYAPGGATDIVARLIGERMRETLGQSFIVESKPGAFGIIAIEEVARSQPDGLTLMVGNVSTNAITPIIYKDKFKVDYEKAIVPVARLASVPSVLAASAVTDVKLKTVKDLVEYGRKNPGKLNYGSAGVGSFPHYDAVLLGKRAGFEAVHVPTKSGATGMLNDMITGVVHYGFINAATSLSMVRDGKMIVLAVVGDKRLPEMPDVPTMAEAGYPGVGTPQWQGLYAPAETPTAILETIRKHAVEALEAPSVKKVLDQSLMKAEPTASLAEAKAWQHSEIELWRKITAESGVKID